MKGHHALLATHKGLLDSWSGKFGKEDVAAMYEKATGIDEWGNMTTKPSELEKWMHTRTQKYLGNRHEESVCCEEGFRKAIEVADDEQVEQSELITLKVVRHDGEFPGAYDTGFMDGMKCLLDELKRFASEEMK